MKKVFLDTNVLLDYVLHRDCYEYADIIFRLSAVKRVELYSSFLSFANIAYILRRHPKDEVNHVLRGLKSAVNVLSMTDSQLERALDCVVLDFEDFLQYQCALEHGCDVMVTNNIKHFKDFCLIDLFTPEEFLIDF